MNALGIQINIDFFECNPEILKDLQKIKADTEEAARKAKATIVKSTVYEDLNQVIVVIAESHIIVKPYPELCIALVSIFTCGDLINTDSIAASLAKKFESKKMSVTERKVGVNCRGGMLSLEEKLPHKVEA